MILEVSNSIDYGTLGTIGLSIVTGVIGGIIGVYSNKYYSDRINYIEILPNGKYIHVYIKDSVTKITSSSWLSYKNEITFQNWKIFEKDWMYDTSIFENINLENINKTINFHPDLPEYSFEYDIPLHGSENASD